MRLKLLWLSFVIQAKAFDKSFEGLKCVSTTTTTTTTIATSKINEVIRAILNFFIQKFHNHKRHKTLTSE